MRSVELVFDSLPTTVSAFGHDSNVVTGFPRFASEPNTLYRSAQMGGRRIRSRSESASDRPTSHTCLPPAILSDAQIPWLRSFTSWSIDKLLKPCDFISSIYSGVTPWFL